MTHAEYNGKGAWSRSGQHSTAAWRPAGHLLLCTRARGTRGADARPLNLTGNTTQLSKGSSSKYLLFLKGEGGQEELYAFQHLGNIPSTQLRNERPPGVSTQSSASHRSHTRLLLDRSVHTSPTEHHFCGQVSPLPCGLGGAVHTQVAHPPFQGQVPSIWPPSTFGQRVPEEPHGNLTSGRDTLGKNFKFMIITATQLC